MSVVVSSSLPLPAERLEGVSSWGGNLRVMSYVYRPSRADAVGEVFALARQHGVSVGPRGGGNSYGDAALNREAVGLDLSRMDRILDWNPDTGRMRVEPGVTVRQMWRHALGDGWWPRVVPGTMMVTVGGALAANIHGKNHVQVGPIGEQVREFDLLLASGETRRCSPTENSDLFHAAIGGFGMLGVVTAATLQLQRVHSGHLRVTPLAAQNWDEMFALFRAHTPTADYLVGWVDAFATGEQAGRGLIQTADYLAQGEDPEPARTLQASYQDLGDEVLGFPKSALYRFLPPALTPRGMRAANTAQYTMGARKAGKPYEETHAAFAFRLDYVPNWKRAYGPGGLLQYQSFVPDADAPAIFASQIERCQQAGLIPTLAVFKRHRADDFLMSYALDGWSLALDFRHTRANHDALMRLFAQMDREVIASGGRFYFAKDSHLHPARLEPFFAEGRVQRFLAMKREVDPEILLQTDLWRRVFGKMSTP